MLGTCFIVYQITQKCQSVKQLWQNVYVDYAKNWVGDLAKIWSASALHSLQKKIAFATATCCRQRLFCRRKRLLATAMRRQCMCCKKWRRQCLRRRYLAVANYFSNGKVGSEDFRRIICNGELLLLMPSQLVKWLRDFAVVCKFISGQICLPPLFFPANFFFLRPHCRRLALLL